MRAAIILFAVAWVGFWLVRNAITQPYDSTDPPGGRSGMVLYTDALTGCQYLRAPLFGSLTPRMGPNGRQLCEGAQ